MSQGPLPILYSYRRCPYAMRARLALGFVGQGFELREIIFRDKPQHMLAVSPKGTVPVMILPDGTVIDESYDIVMYAAQNDQGRALAILSSAQDAHGQALYSDLQESFIGHLNRYKYPDRYPDDDVLASEGPLGYRARCLEFLQTCQEGLQQYDFLVGDQISMYDILLFPLVRQFRVTDPDWFDNNQDLVSLQTWLAWFFDHPIYNKIMEKHDPWVPGDGRDPVMVTCP